MWKEILKKIIAKIRSWLLWLKSLHLLQRTKAFWNLPLEEKKQKIKGWLKWLIEKLRKAWEFISVKILFGSEDETPEEKLKRSMLGKLSLAGVALVLTTAMVFAMTAAWHTNVIQSTGLIFNVSEWGMDGSVNLQNELTNAAPGEKGALNVEVYNSSEGLIDVRLNISKVSLYNKIADMRKRLYFYIEDGVTRNGETTERIYLNSMEDYTYTVLAKQKLQLGEQGNGATLMWEWVYDVLGYYFNGTVTTAGAEITEYLRPITYDFDSATFQGDQLKTVDGTTTAEAFIKKLSQSDGYAGTVGAPKEVNGKIFYPVSVDDSGSGVWMYCCTLSEIEYENVADTNLGNAGAAERKFSTNLNVVAEQKKLTVATANTEEDLRAALADDTHNMIVLSDDMEIYEKISVAAGKQKIVDLADHTISTQLTGTMLDLAEGSSVTMMNGAIAAPANHAGALITAVGSDVALSGLTITNAADAIWIADQSAKKTDTRMNITDCTIRCTDSGVFIKGNGTVTEGRTYLNIENTEIISSGNYGLVGNGSVLTAGNFGTNITVKNSTLKAVYAGIYHPQRDSELLVEGSTIEGMTPFVVKGGAVTIRNSTVNATNEPGTEAKVEAPKIEGNGFSNTGAGLYVETGYDHPTMVEISGNTTITAHHQDAVLLFEKGNSKYRIEVSGGSFSHDVSAFLAKGYSCAADGNGRYIVSKN